MRKETQHLNGLLGKYEQLQHERGSDVKLDIVLDQITKEKARLSPCDKFDQEEVQICRIVNRRRNAR